MYESGRRIQVVDDDDDRLEEVSPFVVLRSTGCLAPDVDFHRGGC